ncbi:MAG TPA: hypothetical protein V6D17_19385 [Candidatus Obscuribacterales bacterium]
MKENTCADTDRAESVHEFPLGDLISEAGWVTQEQLHDAYSVSEQVSVPLGRVLVMRGLITEPELSAAIEVQSLIRDNALEVKEGVKALKVIAWTSLPLEHALAMSGIDIDALPKPKNRIGMLMVSAGYATPENIEEGLTICAATGLPLGKALVLKGLVTMSEVETALWAQRLIRSGKLSRKSAIIAMKRVSHDETEEATKARLVRSSRDETLYELLMCTGIVDPESMSSALRVAKVNQCSLGDMLLVFAVVSPDLLSAANSICEEIKDGTLSWECGARAINLIHTTGAGLSEAMSIAMSIPVNENAKRLQLSTADFLRKIGCLDEGDVKLLAEVAMSDAQTFQKLVLAAGLLDEESIRIATRLKFLVTRAGLPMEKATAIFQNFRASGKIDLPA